MRPESNLMISERRIAIAREMLQRVAKDGERIKWIGGIGSFWTKKNHPNDLDIVVGVMGPIDKEDELRKEIREKILRQAELEGLLHITLDICLIDIDSPLDWRNDPSPDTLLSILESKDIVGVKPEWMAQLLKNIPASMV